jgi:Protein of unknown function (DUF3015)
MSVRDRKRREANEGGNEMKRRNWIQLGAALLALGASPVLAANPDTGPGCGLGKLAWSDYQHQKNIAPQVMMATTNGTFGSQTFGISSGTSGCTNDGVIMGQHKASVFAAANYDTLAQEMARGGGEHLASLAELMGIPAENRSDFFSVAQVQYATLAQSGDRSPAAMIQTLHKGVQAHPSLAQLVSH